MEDTKILIVVEDGMIQNVISNNNNVRFVILDYDTPENIDEDAFPEKWIDEMYPQKPSMVVDHIYDSITDENITEHEKIAKDFLKSIDF